MLTPQWFLSQLMHHQASCVTGVPCSYVSGMYTLLEDEAWPYVSATCEGEAVAIAAGTWLGGGYGVAMCQNSGLGNMLNPLVSLIKPFQIPVLIGVSRRGWPTGTDEPQHTVMGQITPDLLQLLGISAETLSGNVEIAEDQISSAICKARDREPAALIIEKGLFDNTTFEKKKASASTPNFGGSERTVQILRGGHAATRQDVLSAYLELSSNRVTVASTGYTARELYALDDRDSHFYMVGSMGCAAGVGIGLATLMRHRVTVIDGDGSMLMKMGSLATAGRYIDSSFVHIVLDNGQHESTGGQCTNSANVDFAAVANACGYKKVWSCEGIEAIRMALQCAVEQHAGSVFVHCKIQPGVMQGLPRPKQTLPDIALRFHTHLQQLPDPVGSI